MTERALPSGWAWTTLGELGRWYGGGTPSKRNAAFWESGTIPWLSPKDMGAQLLADTKDHITDAAVAGSATTLVPPGSVALVARSGILERRVPISLVPFEVTMNQDMKAIVPHDFVDPKWLFYILQSQEQNMLHDCRKAGTTVASLDTVKLQAIRIPVPPLPEQHRIIETIEDHLSRLDAAEQSLSLASTRAESLGSMAINYSRGVASPSDDYAALPTPADVVDGELPQLPASWTWKRLGEIGEVVGGITKDAKKQSDETFPLHPYLRVANVQAGHLNLEHITEIRATPKQVEKLTLRQGDVLLNEGGDRDKLGRGWIWENQIPNCLHQNHVFRVRVDPDIIDPRLIAWHANSFGRTWFIRNGKQSVNLASVSLTTIKSFPIPVPPPAEQKRIVDDIVAALDSHTRLESAVKAAALRSAAVRRSVLRSAFNGELVDQDPTDEPADVALARLRDQHQTAGSRRRRVVAK